MIFQLPRIGSRDFQEELRCKKLKKKKQRRCTCSGGMCLACQPVYRPKHESIIK